MVIHCIHGISGEGTSEIKQTISVCAIFRDEAKYLDEWLTFHSNQGVAKFYLYNHRSADNFLEVLEPWIKAKRVVLRNAVEKAGRSTQRMTYADCLNRVRFQTKWLALIDIDEFLWSPSGEEISAVLKDFKGAAGIAVRWVLFGSSGIAVAQDAPCLETFKMSLPIGAVSLDDEFRRIGEEGQLGASRPTGRYFEGKSIVNPRKIIIPGVHVPRLYLGKVINEAGNRSPLLWHIAKRRLRFWSTNPAQRLRVNHYWSRSIQELTEKVERSSGSNLVPLTNNREFEVALPLFLERESELNMHEDHDILKYWLDAKRRRHEYLQAR